MKIEKYKKKGGKKGRGVFVDSKFYLAHMQLYDHSPQMKLYCMTASKRPLKAFYLLPLVKKTLAKIIGTCVFLHLLLTVVHRLLEILYLMMKRID